MDMNTIWSGKTIMRNNSTSWTREFYRKRSWCGIQVYNVTSNSARTRSTSRIQERYTNLRYNEAMRQQEESLRPCQLWKARLAVEDYVRNW